MSAERPTQALRRLVNGYQVTQAIHVAATLGIAELLRDGPRTSDELAAETQTHAPSLRRDISWALSRTKNSSSLTRTGGPPAFLHNCINSLAGL